MTQPQFIIVAILLVTIVMFAWGRWRHDMVAAGALLTCVLAGLVSFDAAFTGFSHPAVITVACVLVLSQALQNSGAVDALARAALPSRAGPTLTIAALTGLAAVLSGFMNNVGALALLMPVAIQVAGRLDLPPGKLLMPLAFGSILGGTTTLIGTPPNLIVSGFRSSADLGSYGMFAFTPVGAAVAAVGVAFVALIGWRLVPARKQAGIESFETGAYLTEARVQKDSKAAGMTLRRVEMALEESDAQIVGLVRNEVRVTAPNPSRVVRDGDILILEAEVDALTDALSKLGLKLEEAKKNGKKEPDEKDEAEEDGENGDEDEASAAETAEEEKEEKDDRSTSSDEIALIELAVSPQSELVGRSANDLLLRTSYGINLLAVSRQGRRSTARLRAMQLEGGDVLLVQGSPETIAEFANSTGCLPLAERSLRIPDKRMTIVSSTIMLFAVGGAAFGLVPAAISFFGGVLASMAFRTVSLRTVYEAIDWPVIVLLAALLPVAGAMQSTGAADLIAQMLLVNIAQGDAIVALVVILVTTMVLTDLMNNAATAAVMCPIALGTASQLDANPDTFLMAVAVGASCAFLTPIGHQNNTLILGPGGFRFGDYWKMGLPLDLLVIVVAMPMLLFVWPL
ncbi:MAG: SLC13 family permease [Burkholderiales bacterium]